MKVLIELFKREICSNVKYILKSKSIKSNQSRKLKHTHHNNISSHSNNMPINFYITLLGRERMHVYYLARKENPHISHSFLDATLT